MSRVDFLHFFWKITTFVFLGLSESIQSLQHFVRMESAFCRPLAECEHKLNRPHTVNSLILNLWAMWWNLCLPGLVKRGFPLSKNWITWAKECNLVVHLSGSQKFCPFISALSCTFSFWIKVFNQIVKFSTYVLM